MSIEQEMQNLWGRIEKALQLIAPESYWHLWPGASEAHIEQTEKQLHVMFSEEAKALYRLHDGGLCLDGWAFFSLKSMCHFWMCDILENATEEWEDVQQAYPDPFQWEHGRSAKAREVFEQPPWGCHPRWIPFMCNILQGRSYYMIDLLPGRIGQIVSSSQVYSRQMIEAVIAPSLRTYFCGLADALEAGVYQFDEATGLIWSQERLAALSEQDLANLRKNRQRNKLLDAILSLPEIAAAEIDELPGGIIDLSRLPNHLQAHVQTLLYRIAGRANFHDSRLPFREGRVAVDILNLNIFADAELAELYDHFFRRTLVDPFW